MSLNNDGKMAVMGRTGDRYRMVGGVVVVDMGGTGG